MCCENLLLALEAVGDVLIDEGYGILANRTVRWVNAARVALPQRAQRSEVIAHVAVRWKDRGRAEAEDGVAGEEVSRGGEIADMLVGVSGRRDHFDGRIVDAQRLAAGDAPVDL